jgi:3-hydroxyacyl-[acyl-carrier-protein] dehydratase
VRFLFVDRIVTLEPGRSIETLKNVSTSEDVFEDHFPGYPILPGALVVEAFEQAGQVLIGVSHDFTRIGHLRGVRRAAFRQFVRPGDQLRVRSVRTTADDDVWTMDASGEVDGRRVASAVLEFALVPATVDPRPAERLRALVGALRSAPIDLARGAV